MDSTSHIQSTPRPSASLAAAALIALTLLAYLPALHAGFIWDDQDYITQNLTLRTPAGLAAIWTNPHANFQYYPLVFTSFWLEYHAWSLSPIGYHLDNILLQAASALLLWRLLLQLKLPAPWLAAAIFAVHPVQTETVAWVTERKNLLCGVFYLAAMLVHFRPTKKYTYPATLALFTCAMLSKSVALTWPLAAPLLLWWKSRLPKSPGIAIPGSPPPKYPHLLPLLPFAAIGLSLSLLTAKLESAQVGAAGPDWNFTPADRLIIAGRALWFYALKTIAPVHLTFIYPRWNLHTARPAQALFPAAAAAILLTLFFLRRQIGRGPFTAALLFVLTLSPALGFVNFYPMRYSFVADHFQYLAIIALIVPLATLLHRLAGNYAAVILIPLTIMTFLQCQIYHDPLTLWTDTVAKNPDSWMARLNLGHALESLDRLDPAEDQYRHATLVAPDEADTWFDLGRLQANRGNYAAAEPNIQRAVQLDPSNPVAQNDLTRLKKLLGE